MGLLLTLSPLRKVLLQGGEYLLGLRQVAGLERLAQLAQQLADVTGSAVTLLMVMVMMPLASRPLTLEILLNARIGLLGGGKIPRLQILGELAESLSNRIVLGCRGRAVLGQELLQSRKIRLRRCQIPRLEILAELLEVLLNLLSIVLDTLRVVICYVCGRNTGH